MPKPDERRFSAPRDSRRSAPPSAALAAVKAGVPHGAAETGWLPDLLYTGEAFEAGLAFFADAQGRIVRFSREPADLAVARRLEGQAVLPGIVTAHSHSFHRGFRGRGEQRARVGAATADQVLAALSEEDVFDAARMAFMEMLLSGVTCVGEFLPLHRQPDGSPYPDPNHLSLAVLRAAHDVGIRISLLRAVHGPGDVPAAARFRVPAIDDFVRETEALRETVAREFPGDEAWLGIGAGSPATVPLDQLKALGTYARAQRLRLQVHVSATTGENEACVAAHGRTPIALLAEHGLVDKRFTAVDAAHLTDDEVKLLGAARTMVCLCPTSTLGAGHALPPIDALLAAGAGVALGTDANVQVDPLKEARLLEYHLRGLRGQRTGFANDPVAALFHAATVTGARSLGATGGALEVGRPADFFTVSLYDPSMVGSDPATLLANVMFSLERRAIRDVWVGARLRISNGRHVAHGAIVGRFADGQRRLWDATAG